jgi:hypothetical protein
MAAGYSNYSYNTNSWKNNSKPKKNHIPPAPFSGTDSGLQSYLDYLEQLGQTQGMKSRILNQCKKEKGKNDG